MKKAKQKKSAPNTYKGLKRETYDSLVHWFRIGASEFEACHASKLKLRIYNEFVEKHPEERELFEGYRSELITKARQNIAKKIHGGCAKSSMWYLERKAPSEFGAQQVINASGGLDVRIIDDI